MLHSLLPKIERKASKRNTKSRKSRRFFFFNVQSNLDFQEKARDRKTKMKTENKKENEESNLIRKTFSCTHFNNLRKQFLPTSRCYPETNSLCLSASTDVQNSAATQERCLKVWPSALRMGGLGDPP